MEKYGINTGLDAGRLNEEFRLSQERLKIVLGHVKGDIWEYVHSDKTMRRLTTYDPYIELDTVSEPPGQKSPNSFIHADSMSDALEMLKELEAGAEVSARELRFISKNGEELWFNVLFRNIFGESGLPIAAIGISENITRRKELEAHDLQQRKYIDSIVSKAIGVYEINLTRGIVERPADMPPAHPGEDMCLQLLFRGDDWIISPYDMDIVETELSRGSLLSAFEEGRAQARCEYRRVMMNSSNCWVSVVANLARDAKSGDVYALIYVKNIDDRKTREHELRKKASFDSLTGFYNRETGIEKISESLKLRQHGTVSALLMLDLDNFKVLNDSLGHSTGDSFLKDMADAIRSLVRMDDILCRVGGDEFFIYMNSVTETLVRNRVRKLCDAVKEVGGRYDADYLSVSVGVALVDDYKHAFQEVYERADKALYEAKRNGKNGFAIYF